MSNKKSYYQIPGPKTLAKNCILTKCDHWIHIFEISQLSKMRRSFALRLFCQPYQRSMNTQLDPDCSVGSELSQLRSISVALESLSFFHLGVRGKKPIPRPQFRRFRWDLMNFWVFNSIHNGSKRANWCSAYPFTLRNLDWINKIIDGVLAIFLIKKIRCVI